MSNTQMSLNRICWERQHFNELWVRRVGLALTGFACLTEKNEKTDQRIQALHISCRQQAADQARTYHWSEECVSRYGRQQSDKTKVGAGHWPNTRFDTSGVNLWKYLAFLVQGHLWSAGRNTNVATCLSIKILSATGNMSTTCYLGLDVV